MSDAKDSAFAAQVHANQRTLVAGLKSRYDFIVCGSGSSGAVVARRLAENPEASVLLLEAGGSDDVPSVTESAQWRSNLGSERDWDFKARPDASVRGRSMPMNMGKVLGGGSSINAMYWVRGHRSDWDYFASETGDPAWSYERVTDIYRRIEDWGGTPDADLRGNGGLVFVSPARLLPIGTAMREAALASNIQNFESLNGPMMTAESGCALSEHRIRDGKRLSIYRSYVFPYMDRSNLTVLTHAVVTRLMLDGKRTAGVEVYFGGQLHRIEAEQEVVLSLGAINTPKVLMQSGIGDQAELRRAGIPVIQHLPGVGQNFQDHCMFRGCAWRTLVPVESPEVSSQTMLFWRSRQDLVSPDIQIYHGLNLWSGLGGVDSMTILPTLVRPRSRGHLRLTGPSPRDPLEIYANTLSDPEDLKAMVAAIGFCRKLGRSASFRPFLRHEVVPGDLKGFALEDAVRTSVSTIWHQSGTAKMGRDGMSVVDGRLKVYGIDNLRVADASVMPHISTGNTMAPCVIIGERCADAIKADW
ncbi:GMC family oxidoreductase [Paraburkholderia solisilvae]|uniref:GMC family oxidoreductase n=1 Tax=Paraburkholderia solisilvae TaxID=624376 RepID=UPI001582FD25|nr:GMC family oxidoreductase N-terminal domain-containing protein [Paraburkholderia solisilvae]